MKFTGKWPRMDWELVKSETEMHCLKTGATVPRSFYLNITALKFNLE